MKLRKFMSDTLSFGKGSVKIPSAEIIESFKNKYDMLSTEGLKFKVFVYRLFEKNSIIIHTKVPSETVRGFYYDVLLELASNGANDFEDCDIKIFSNCPSFVYTYAYVFYHLEDEDAKTKGLIIDEYDKKIPKENLIITGASKKLTEEILHGRPVVRNPYGLPLFDKSVYYAIFNMIDKLDFNRTVNSRKYIRSKQLFDSVLDFETLMTKRHAMETDIKNKKHEKKKSVNKTFSKIEKAIDDANHSKSTKMVEKITSSKNKIKPIGAIKPLNRK